MATPSVSVASEAESWDDDNDFDWSETPAAPMDRLTASSANTAEATTEGAQRPPSEAFSRIEDDAEEGFGDFDADEDEEVDTLKVSDLNKETLAQLAAYAKKKVTMSTTQISHLDQAALPPLIHRLGPPSALPMSKGAFDRSWDEDLEIPDTLSIESLKPRRYASFQSDGDFEAPSVVSTSESSTSGSHRSSTGPLAVPLHKRDASGVSRSPHSSASSSAHLSPTVAQQRRSDRSDDDADESDFVLSDSVQMLRLGPRIVRQPSQDMSDASKRRQSSAVWGADEAEDESLAVPQGKSHKAHDSVSSAMSSEKSSENERRDGVEEESFDDLDFSTIALPPTVAMEEDAASKPAPSFADKLRARLEARKAGGEAGGEAKADGSSRGGQVLENDAVSGLIITDDMDLSPSRLRARNLSDRLREAARSRRRRQDAKHKNVDAAAAVTETPAGAAKSGETRRSGQVVGNATQASMRFPSGRQGAAAAAGRARGLSAQSRTATMTGRQMSGEQGRAAQIAGEQRQGGPRPHTPVILSNSTNSRIASSGRVTPQQAGVMSYALPTAASLARRLPMSLRSDSWLEETLALHASSIPTAPRFMRQPRNARNYGDGRELDKIEDLSASEVLQQGANQRTNAVGKQTSAQGVRRGYLPTSSSDNAATDLNTAPASVSSRRSGGGGGRSRRKKLPFLIRDLGGAAKTTKMVGEMRWNPVLKCWEGNEKEGRDFEVAIRGTGRPALITPFALSSSSTDSNLPLSPMSPAPKPVSRSLSSSMLSPGMRSPAAVGIQVVGDMMFDPVQMCWVRQDGEDETDPFDGHDDEEDRDEDGLAREDDIQRQIRQRSVSAELMPASMHALRAQRSTDQIDGGHNRGAKMGQIGLPLDLAPTEVEQMIAKEVASAASQVPPALKDVIPLPIWLETIEAQQRHQRQMAGFLPSRAAVRRGTARSLTGERRGKAAVATSSSVAAQIRRNTAPTHLYFIRDRSL